MTKYGKETVVGFIGLTLTSILWCLSSWRLLFHCFTRRRRRQQQQEQQEEGRQAGRRRDESDRENRSRRSTSSSSSSSSLPPPLPRQSLVRQFTRKRTFHALLWMATSCEALAYADLAGLLSIHKDPKFAAKLGYVLLDVAGRSILELLSFCTVTAIWLKTAIESSPTVLWGSQSTPFGILPSLFLMTLFLLVFASAFLSVVELVIYQDLPLVDIEKRPWGRAQMILEAIAWGFHSLVVVRCLIVTSRRVLNLVPTMEWSDRLSLLSKAVLPMLVTSILYAIRCIWLLLIVFDRWTSTTIDRDTWIWWIGFTWIPSWSAVGFLLYSARKRDSGGGTMMDGQSNEPLLPSRRLPTEAFIAFSRHRNGLLLLEENEEDSFFSSFLRSPPPPPAPIIHNTTSSPTTMIVTDDEESDVMENLLGVSSETEPISSPA